MNKFFYLIIPIFVLVSVVFGLMMESKVCSGDMSFYAFGGADKLLHFVLFFGLAMVFHGSFFCFYQSTGKRLGEKHFFLFILIFLGIFFAGLTEWLQEHFTITRDGDIFDFLSNLLGIFFYILFYRFFLLRFLRLIYSYS